ncbi:MAG: UbiX family flavin prenyltransferase [Thermoplasmatales archaeon]|nr:UbiX family flavin prenyltransferase [Thermoplasmatales archaeon]MCW6170477.1 UbiX family flavin prenyltransferase [Thermoplasmatales archaeon]
MRIVICITGATGAIYGYRLLLAVKDLSSIESYLIITKDAETTLKLETNLDYADVSALATHVYDENDFQAPIASGSFITDGTIIAPCSMKTLSAIANGYEQNLVSRTAMVSLKEKRPLIVMVRETPFNIIHLKNMVSVAEAGGIIMPPMPPFYFKIKNINEMVDLTVGRALNMLGIETALMKQWGVDK